MDIIAWITDHGRDVAPYGALAFIWKIFGVANKLKVRAEKSEETLEKVATNHLPHIQAELEKHNEQCMKILTGIDRLIETQRDSNQLLAAILQKK